MSAPAHRRTQAERRAASEASLLKAAAEIVAEVGLERASLREIGARAGASRGMPAYIFGSKENLIARLVEQAAEQTVSATAELVGGDADFAALPRLELLRLTLGQYLEMYSTNDRAEDRAVVAVWGATLCSQSEFPSMHELDRQTHAMIAQTIREGQADGSIRPEISAEAAAVLLMGMTRGAAALTLSLPGAADPRDVRGFFDHVLAAAFGTTEAPTSRPVKGRPATKTSSRVTRSGRS